MKNLLSLVAVIAVLVAVAYFGGCSYRNVETIKDNAEATWAKAGFEVVGYEGYLLGTFGDCPGGRVWYIVQRKGNDKVRYHGFISKWGNEFHIYNLRAIDAVTAH